jgi:stearoyl-CoA desaturase (Delta-9 desaturase)
MKYLSATPRSLFLLQSMSLIVILAGMFFIEFTWHYALMSVLFFYLYSIVGVSMMLHRYYSHKSFKLHPIVKWILTVFAVLAGRGSPLGWVYIHRIHHGTSDTEKDPHSPHFDTFKFIGFKPVYDDTKKINYFIVKELLTPAHIKIDKYYMLLILTFILALSIIDYNLVYYIWALPVFAVSVSQVCFNYFCHMHGYRNVDTKDKSSNNIYMWPFILGDAWHNNHHAHAERLSSKIKWWEFDPVAVLAKLVSSRY